jgi:hypothetical protein
MQLAVSRRSGIWFFLVPVAVLAIAAVFVPRMDLPPSYHHFADQRGWLGVPHFGDVASNLAYLAAGLWGLSFLGRRSNRTRFVDPLESWPYMLVFFGLVLTAFGSAYYHLAPDNDRLVWDRLPMTIVFMPLVAALIAERVSVKLGVWLLPILTAAGIASVLLWHQSVQRGAGDLRFYGTVQLYAVLAIFIALLLPSRYTRNSDLLIVAGFYALAKVCETADHQIFSVGHMVSGHTLKHLASAAAGLWILRMLKKKQLVPRQELYAAPPLTEK